MELVYRISSKSHHTSKLYHPWSAATCFCQLIPISVTLEILLHDKGRQLYTYICAHTLYMHTHRLIIWSCVRAYLSISVDATVAFLQLSLYQMWCWNEILLRWDFEKIWYDIQIMVKVDLCVTVVTKDRQSSSYWLNLVETCVPNTFKRPLNYL